jgi:hypothetical protein
MDFFHLVPVVPIKINKSSRVQNNSTEARGGWNGWNNGTV